MEIELELIQPIYTIEISPATSTVIEVQAGLRGPRGDSSTGTVSSVNGKTGIIVLSKSDIGLSDINNTSDKDKPLSDAAVTALSGKSNVGHSHPQSEITGLSAALSAKADTSAIVPTSRTIAGKPLSANITLAKADVGLSNVDNTSDLTKFSAYGVRTTIFYASGAWPSRTVPAGYSGSVIWDSSDSVSATAPPGGLDGDRWIRRVS